MISVLESGIIEVDLLPDIISEATRLTELLKVESDRSIIKGAGNLTGYIGEAVFSYVFEDAERKNSPHYDFIWRKLKVDVKTKLRKVKAEDSFDASIAAYSLPIQQCDGYVFVSISLIDKKAWIMGAIRKSLYKEKARFFEEGAKDPEFPAYKFRCPTYNVQYRQLTKLGEDWWKRKENQVGR